MLEAGGGDHAAGGGGYTGGSGQPHIARADNGLTADLNVEWGTGGAYFMSGKTTSNRLTYNTETYAYIGGQGALANNYNTQGGDGGIAGKGGIIKVSSDSRVYAYNGNKYTDGTDYNEGENQLEIDCQNGKLRNIYKYDVFWNAKEYRYVEFFKQLFGTDVNSAIDSFTASPAKRSVNHSNYLVRVEKNIIKLTYRNSKSNKNFGIGSGAGYIELSNGEYIIDSSMN